jgi:hypothetical protein
MSLVVEIESVGAIERGFGEPSRAEEVPEQNS